jgi:hypothetical protein
MKRKMIIGVLLSAYCMLFAFNSASAEPQNDVVNHFINYIISNERESAKQYLFDKEMKIPEITENTPISGFVILPTPQRNDTNVVVTYFKGEVGGERIAFVWELVVRDEKISYIQVIHDGTKPLLEEAKLVKEYQLKYHRRVLVPYEYPAEITSFNGYIAEENEVLHLGYGMESLHSFLHITIFPITENLDQDIGKNTEILKFKDGTKVLYNANFDLGYEMRFQKDGLNYKIQVGKKNLSKKFTLDDLMQIAESMK